MFDDPVEHGAADPVLIYNKQQKMWWMFYTNCRATLNDSTAVEWVHGTKIGIAESKDGQVWKYKDTPNINYRVNPVINVGHLNNLRYDTYDRSKSKVYIGEYASKGNKLFNALAEAVYMTALERNGDVVKMESYAPLIARQNHTSWNPNLIYFSNTAVAPTVNYYVQQLFSTNQGDRYYADIVSFPDQKVNRDSTLATSFVKDSKTGDLILKLVNAGPASTQVKVNLAGFDQIDPKASRTILTGAPVAENSFTDPVNVIPETSDFVVRKSFFYEITPYSLTIIRMKASTDRGVTH